nr:hypothetical protein [Solirubrobacterales bacterium]
GLTFLTTALCALGLATPAEAAIFTVNKTGDASDFFKPGKKVPPGRKITVTATNSSGSTSEFSAPRKVTRP